MLKWLTSAFIASSTATVLKLYPSISTTSAVARSTFFVSAALLSSWSAKIAFANPPFASINPNGTAMLSGFSITFISFSISNAQAFFKILILSDWLSSFSVIGNVIFKPLSPSIVTSSILSGTAAIRYFVCSDFGNFCTNLLIHRFSPSLIYPISANFISAHP
ncbi:hypothetical protein SDC9_186813 [bioreactor metagenome]|uniref:Uncharacterized protein n=1 Tax=bioreactor metagenome TaxID=1076179 RepID=A0A645HJU6_9ZZZZ